MIVDGNELGNHVANYQIQYSDGSSELAAAILRRFAIQQAHIRWGASAVAMPMQEDQVFPMVTEEYILRGRGPTESITGGAEPPATLPDGAQLPTTCGSTPCPTRSPQSRSADRFPTPQQERALIYGITLTNVTEHPLRVGVRQKLRS